MKRIVVPAVLRIFCGCGGYIRINNQGRPQCDRCHQLYG